MASAPKQDVFACILKILRCYTEETEINDALRVLHDKKAISDEFYASLTKEEKGNLASMPGAIFALASNCIAKSPNWKQLVLGAFGDKAFPGDRQLKKLLRYAIETSDDNLRYLIYSWDKLDGLKDAILHYMKNSWSRSAWKKCAKQLRTKKYPWKVYVLHKCASKKSAKIKALADKVRDLISGPPSQESNILNDPDDDLSDIILELRLSRADPSEGGEYHVILSSDSCPTSDRPAYRHSVIINWFVTQIRIPREVEEIGYKLIWKKNDVRKDLYYGKHPAERIHTVTKEEKNIGHILLYDIVNGEDGVAAEQFMELALDRLHTAFPPLSDRKGIWQTGISSNDQLSVGEELYYWVQQIVKGWKLARDTRFQFEAQAVLDQTLVLWLSTIYLAEDQKCTRRRIISLVIFLGLIRKKHTAQNETIVLICNALSVHRLDIFVQQNLQDALLDEYDSLESLPQIVSVFHALFKRIKFNMTCEWILMLPLYWLIESDSVPPIFPDTLVLSQNLPALPKIDDCNWEEVRWKLSNDASQQVYIGMLQKIREISSVHPWIIKPYLYMLRGITIHSIVQADMEEIKFISPVLAILRMIDCARTPEKSEMDLKCVREVSRYVEEYLKGVAEQIRNSSADESSFHQIEEFLQRLVKCLEETEEKDWDNIIWCLDCGYKVVNCVLEKELYHGVTTLWELLLYTCKKTKESSDGQGSSMTYENWNHLVSYKWAGDGMPAWNEKVKEAFMEKLDANCKDHEERFLEEYVRVPKDLQKPIQECLDKKCGECVKHVLLKPWYEKVMKSDHHKPLAKIFENIFSSELKKIDPLSTDPTENKLRFILAWSPSTVFYQKFYHKKLTKDAPSITSVTRVFSVIIESLKAEDITMKFLKIIMSDHDKVVSLHAAIKQEDGSPVDNKQHISVLLTKRREQLEKTEEVCQLLKDFKLLCDSLVQVNVPVNFESVKCILDDESVVKLSELTKRIQIGDENGKEITADDIMNLKKIIVLKDNGIFKHLWIKTALKWDIKQKKRDQSIDCNWKIALQEIWTTAKHELAAYNKLIQEGKLYLSRLDSWFGRSLSEADSSLHDIFSYHGNTLPAQEQIVLDQINFFMALKKCKDAMEFALQLRTLFSLTGYYGPLENFLDMVRKQSGASNPLLGLLKKRCQVQTRRVIDKSIMRSKKKSKGSAHCRRLPQKQCGWRLHDIAPEMMDNGFIHSLQSIGSIAEELKVFLKQKRFINWLQQKIHDRDEINSMCDLALTDNADTITKNVNSFSNAVHGFAPLIFDIVGRNIGIAQLAERCKDIQTNVDEKPFLKEDWEKSADSLPLFEEIELRHGSVEKSFLQTVQHINSKGVFEVKCGSQDMPGNNLSLESIIHVSFANDAKKQEMPIHFNKLHEIHSVLMLITNTDEQSRKSITRFSSLFTAVEKLAQALIVLIEIGCMLFSNFSAVISPKPESSKAVLSVKFDDTTAPLGDTCALEDIGKLAMVLEETRSKWSEYILDKRMKYYYLNEYSLSQITYLCRELATSLYTNVLPDQVHALLASVCRGRYPNVEQLLDEATSMLREDQETPEPSMTIHASGDDSKNLPRNKEQAVRELCSDGIDENVAKAAVQGAGDEDPVNWALINQHDDELIATLCEKFDMEMAFSTDGPRHQVTASLTHNSLLCDLWELVSDLQISMEADDSSTTLFSSVKTICDRFITKTSELTLRNFLSMEHLGRFLTSLKMADHTTDILSRSLIKPLLIGKPNLVICNDEEVLATVIALYMHNPDLPLPTKSEVLVCSEATTADDVQRFMRRAMTRGVNKGRPLFCLPFLDKLKFNVMKAMEDIYNALREDKNLDENYQLALICSNQKSYLASCFEKNQVNIILDKSREKISAYIGKYLVASEAANESAACVDEKKRMIRVVGSAESGNGKSLYIQRLKQKLKKLKQMPRVTTIRFLEKDLNPDVLISKSLVDCESLSYQDPNFIWLDITPGVKHGVERFVFDLLILGYIEDSCGKIWRRDENHFYIVEVTDGALASDQFSIGVFNFLPYVIAVPPCRTLDQMCKSHPFIGMDKEEFLSPTFQRPYQYLKRLTRGSLHDLFVYKVPEGDADECVETLLQNTSLNVSWSQLSNFARFSNLQLENCEKSNFLNPAAVGFDLKGFKQFVVKFMIRMAQDFGTPTNMTSDGCFPQPEYEASNIARDQFSGRRGWEGSLHPYVLFNEDQETVTFINVNLSDYGDLIDYNNKTLHTHIADSWLVACLKQQGIVFGKRFDEYTRMEKLEELCKVMGVTDAFDPDETYELTGDCVQKMIAIHMRFRCRIPVIIMGETGCGKTRMVDFMSKLLAGKPTHGETAKSVKNLIVRKIYSGITTCDVFESVRSAEKLAKRNQEEHGLATILFYDEANTTDAIHAIKEVMCDHTVDGKELENVPLLFIAACNPYKKLSKHAIKRLEESGLGSKIHAGKADERGGSRMRSLLYKVNPLPPSMNPFVWDFGQLGTSTEALYIQQMAKRLKETIHVNPANFCSIVSHAQQYMRKQEDECRFVSLRDVERCMDVFEWFLNNHETLFPLIEEQSEAQYQNMGKQPPVMTTEERAIVQTLGVCYHASLEDRHGFRECMCQAFREVKINRTLTQQDILQEFNACEKAFLKGISLGGNISCNKALMENFFMMAICAELKIPLFIIGKPGSSKSLAKSLISNNMQGKLSRTKLFQRLKQVRLVSYQCSALSDAEGIKRIFKQCVELQTNEDNRKKDSYVSVVVLDEIGLAEDSPNMPLKILHPLLEAGTMDSECLTGNEGKKKVGFIGISNWPLDPAKLNRGIFVLRQKPNKDDLLHVAKSLGQDEQPDRNHVLTALIDAYLEVYNRQNVEYYGLRDYYSLMKMIYGSRFCSADVSLAIIRNFSGAKEPEAGQPSVVQVFQDKLSPIFPDILKLNIPIKGIVSGNLRETDTRFLLLLTNHYPSLNYASLLCEHFEENFEVVFGSSFLGDHNYTEICRNINRIKVCMEMGKWVVLLNMADVHESLYDALNQHFITLGGKRYVDLGLGEHRVKCCVSPEFRLMVIEQKNTAYNEYPIPLLNRLEKHNLDAESLLPENSQENIEELQNWVESFAGGNFELSDSFIGYHKDTVPSILLFQGSDIKHCKSILLQSVAMDAVFRRLSILPEADAKSLQDIYFEEQKHGSMIILLKSVIENQNLEQVTTLEVVSYSHVLSVHDRIEYENQLGLSANSMMVMNLEQFYTRKECEDKLDIFFKRCKSGGQNCHQPSLSILLVQCSQAQRHGHLIECFRNIWSNKMNALETASLKRSIIMIIFWSIERSEKGGVAYSGQDTGNFVLQQAKDYSIIYVDELLPADEFGIPTLQLLKGKVSDVFISGSQDGAQHMMQLMRSSVCDAIRKVRVTQNEWYFRCLKILTGLFSNRDDISNRFRRIVQKKLVGGLAKVTENEGSTVSLYGSMRTDSWLTKESHNQENLQEGGTFRKTLLLHLKNLFSQLLAYMISIIDGHGNLSLLTSDNQETWKIDMWLRYFEDMPIEWDANVLNTQEFYIPTLNISASPHDCQLPFSSMMTHFFQEAWCEIKCDQTNRKRLKLIESFRTSHHSTPAGSAVTKASAETVMSTYVRDIISMLYVPVTTHDGEIDAVQKILFKLSLHEHERMLSNLQQGDEIPLAFCTFKVLSKNLKNLADIIWACPQVLTGVDSWIEKQKQSENSLIHISALVDALNILRNNAKTKNIDGCFEWIKAFSLMKQIFPPILDLVKDSNQRNLIIKNWVPLSLLDILLLQLIPCEESEKLRYAEVIWVQAKLMLRGSETNDLQSESFLVIVCNVLKKCYEEIRLRFVLSWNSTKCKHCKRPMKQPQLLDCGHFICQTCYTKYVMIGTPVCPFCRNSVSAAPKGHAFTQEMADKLANFKLSCTGFFIELLRNICFSTKLQESSEAKFKGLIKILLTLVDGIEREGKPKLLTEAIDLDINTRSNILNILIKAHPVFTKRQLDNSLKILELSNPSYLTDVIIYFFEQQIVLKHASLDILPEENMKREKAMLENAWERLSIIKGNIPDMGMLQHIAEVRYSLRRLSSYMYGAYLTNTVSELLQAYYASAEMACGEYKSNVLRQFLVKAGCKTSGNVWYSCLADSKKNQDLIPFELSQSTTDLMGDYWALMGNEYTNAKKLFFTSSDEDVANIVNESIFNKEVGKKPYKVLALLKWAQISAKHAETILHTHEASKMESIILLNQESFHCPAETYTHDADQLILLVAMVLNKGLDLMSGFGLLATQPSATSAISPSSMFTENIFCAGSDWATYVIQMILHASLRIGSMKDRNAVTKMLGLEDQPGLLKDKLMREILTNIGKQSCVLKRSKHEVLIILHLVLSRIMADEKEEHRSETSLDWTTAEGRKTWKKQFHDRYLQAIYEDIEHVLLAAEDRIEEDMSAFGNPLFRLVMEIPPEVMPKEILSWKHPLLWRYTKECTLDDFLQNLQTDEAIRAEILTIIFQTKNLELVKDLEKILELQKILIMRCQNSSLCFSDAETEPLQNFLESNEERMMAEKYIDLWNKVCSQEDFRKMSRKRGLSNQLLQSVTMEIPVSFAMPSRCGWGQCAQLLASYLIDIQNSFLEKCSEAGKYPENTAEVEIPLLTHSHLICIDKQQDLIPLIYTYTKYEVSTSSDGRQHKVMYNLEALEKQVEEKFVNYKRKINMKTIPSIRYPKDVVETDLQEVIDKTVQRKLPESMVQQIDGSSSHSTLIYAGVRALKQAITYIAKGEVKPEMKLRQFLRTKLALPVADLHAIPTTANIEHTLALYLRLSWHRSIIFMSRGLDPYKDLFFQVEQETIVDETLKKEIQHAFRHVDIPLFQQQINELIIRRPGFSANASLAEEVLCSYQFVSDGSKQEWYAKIPTKVLMKHLSHLIRLSLEYQQSVGLGDFGDQAMAVF